MSTFTELKPKDLQKFFALRTYEAARKMAVHIRDIYNTHILTVKHLALYLGLPESDILHGLK